MINDKKGCKSVYVTANQTDAPMKYQRNSPAQHAGPPRLTMMLICHIVSGLVQRVKLLPSRDIHLMYLPDKQAIKTDPGEQRQVHVLKRETHPMEMTSPSVTDATTVMKPTTR